MTFGYQCKTELEFREESKHHRVSKTSHIFPVRPLLGLLYLAHRTSRLKHVGIEVENVTHEELHETNSNNDDKAYCAG